MNVEGPSFSDAFSLLYCDAMVFNPFSVLHPISFTRILPFQHRDEGVDEIRLLSAEQAHLAQQNDATRGEVLDQYARCGLLDETAADQLKTVPGFFDADFFEFMGEVYANAGRFRCALRWYREFISRLETQNPNACSDTEGVYADVGYCLYSLWLFEEAIAWSKACIGPRHIADTVCRALLEYEAQLTGGAIRAVERAGPRVRYTASTFDPEQSIQATARLKATMKAFAPFQDVYLDWVSEDSPKAGPCPDGYPFKAEFDAGTLVRHKTNLVFATCAHADALAARGYQAEAKRLLWEAMMIEPEAKVVAERLRALV